MVQKRFYNIEEMATILGKTPAAIHGHLARKQFDAVPHPMRLGRRLAWMIEVVDTWIEGKKLGAEDIQAEYREHMQPGQSKKLGRPTKAEARARRAHD